MRFHEALKFSTALSSAMLVLVGAPAIAQTTDAAISEGDAPKADIVVTGVRGSVEAATTNKKNSKQIVDSVVAEDVGKLPDNNVPEALARVTGVQIDRARGQGQSVVIRGLSGAQTTVNGNNTNLGDGRSLNLSDIPAELLKQVDVYKTRSADQVEGSIAGAVNVELRRPFDMKKGLTVAGSIRGSYDDISKKVSPYGSLLLADRFETGIGEIGVLVNASMTKTNYRENFIESESPFKVATTDGTIVIPYRAQYGIEQGSVKRPSINGVLQWRASDKLDFVIEGSYLGSREKRSVERLYVQDMQVGTYSDLVLMPDGKTVKSVTLTNPNGLAAGIDSLYNTIHSNLYTTNFEAHWRSDRVQINSSVQYNWSNEGNYFVESIIKPGVIHSASVDFASNLYSKGVPSITFNGVDLNDLSAYGVERFQDNRGGSRNKEFAAQTDLTLTVSETGFLRNLQVGGRFNQRRTSRYYGYRDGFPRVNGAYAPLSMFPGYDDASMVGPDIGGATTQWYRIPGAAVLANIDAYRELIQQTDPANATRFSSIYPPSDQGQTFRSNEKNFAAYAQINYAFDIGTIPVDGLAGVRYTNTWGTSQSFNYRPGNAANGNQEIVEESPGSGNYFDILPTVSAVVHFTPKAQLRLSYSTNVQRPGFYDMRPFYSLNTSSNPPIVYAGNPKLKAQREQAFDVSAEYYFGRGGQISLAGYYKKATGFLLYSREQASRDEMLSYGINLDDYAGASFGYVEQLRNVGDGTFAGLEGTFQTFFDFAPGILRNFGVSLNASHMMKARVEYAAEESFPGEFDSPNTSKWTANAALFYDTPSFSARVAFNYRSSYRLGVWLDNGDATYSPYNGSTSKLDAAVNYTPVPFMTLSVEASNILGNDVFRYHGSQELLPLGVRTLARTVQGSMRFRF
ncbi:TonB-dependent receptor [Novosphingobium resinovorum]|uniref:TonB-dependent receptor n=1 Tax=Novosphingobium TaxID=165696 RepID=UPI001B3C56E7|nr:MULTISPECIES: TonB-dependent receptor [Novosphingobium]MBF7015011.1 TonB-dependent receptor [Novosphingobium sp. HR1a]WJM24519.1 TonB-dependent receptor [Novosphingobium resinovorum]